MVIRKIKDKGENSMRRFKRLFPALLCMLFLISLLFVLGVSAEEHNVFPAESDSAPVGLSGMPFHEFARIVGYFLNTLSAIAVIGIVTVLIIAYRRFSPRHK